jgi:hypothetical protein
MQGVSLSRLKTAISDANGYPLRRAEATHHIKRHHHQEPPPMPTPTEVTIRAIGRTLLRHFRRWVGTIQITPASSVGSNSSLGLLDYQANHQSRRSRRRMCRNPIRHHNGPHARNRVLPFPMGTYTINHLNGTRTPNRCLRHQTLPRPTNNHNGPRVPNRRLRQARFNWTYRPSL